MRKLDPFSTPARRRRIIADLAKTVLRQYCVIGCANVLRFRQQTAASTIIQCKIRCVRAKRELDRRLFVRQSKAAIAIQSIFRMKLAVLLKGRLKRDLRRRQELKLALCLQTLFRNRKERLHLVALMVARRLALEKRRQRAATDIQRVFRGHLGRVAFEKKFSAFQARVALRRACAIKIQSCCRMHLAVTCVSVKRTRLRIRRISLAVAMKRWATTQIRHHKMVIVAQCAVRCYLARCRSMRRRALLELMRLDKTSECRPVSPFPPDLAQVPTPPPAKTMHIQIDLGQVLLCKMASLGASYVVSWCVENSVLHYNSEVGFVPGAVVGQVVAAVDSAMACGDVSDTADHTDLVARAERMVTVAKWMENGSQETPPAHQLPSDWCTPCCSEGGAELSVDLLSNKIQLNILLRPKHDSDRDASHSSDQMEGRIYEYGDSQLTFEFRSTKPPPVPPLPSTLICIVFSISDEHQEGEMPSELINLLDASKSEYIVNGCAGEEVGSSLHSMADSVKFRFKNALVQVTTAAPAVKTTVEPEPEVIDSGAAEESQEMEVPLPPPELVPERPRTAPAVVRVVLREPSPPPVDFEFMARRIQIAVRRRLMVIDTAAWNIQQMIRRSYLLHNWKAMVRAVLEDAHLGARKMQTVVRRFLARRELGRRRAAYVYGHDFAVDELANWRAFGLLVDEDSSRPGRAVWRCVQRAGAGPLHPVSGVLQLIQLPGPPDGSLVPGSNLVWERFQMRDGGDESVAINNVAVAQAAELAQVPLIDRSLAFSAMQEGTCLDKLRNMVAAFQTCASDPVGNDLGFVSQHPTVHPSVQPVVNVPAYRRLAQRFT